MCGISGTLALDGQPLAERAPSDLDILRHRGPDDFGLHESPIVRLVHRRLSIIDVDGGRQPIYSEDGACCAILNGEIYNFRELRTQLEAKGHVFATRSDTETIVHGYEEWGEDVLTRLRGMFALALWDEGRTRLILARDRLGIKPLFYARVGNQLRFASEMKAILSRSDFRREINPEAMSAFFALTYIPAPWTIYSGIEKLLPGHVLIAERGEVRTKKYWDLTFAPEHARNVDETARELMERLEDAVRVHMVSDVPVGSFLSGGIDSGVITALMSQMSPEPVRTFSIGFGGTVGGYLDERGYAEQLATRYSTNHCELEVTPNVEGVLGKIVRGFDEPFADDSTVPSYYLAELARRDVKVALSGLGGDELFGGYNRYLGFKMSFAYNVLPRYLRESVIRRIVDELPERSDGHYTINHLKRFVRSASMNAGERYFGFLSTGQSTPSIFAEEENYRHGYESCRELVLSHFNSSRAASPLDKMFYCDMKTYLPDDILACTDRTSMAHSLEVRVPFLDHELVEFAATIPAKYKVRYWVKKYILRRAAGKLLPAEILRHRKQGFASPMTQWLRGDLREYVKAQLSPKRLDRLGLFNVHAVQDILRAHFEGREIHDKIIWSLLVFDTWHSSYVENNDSARPLSEL